MLDKTREEKERDLLTLFDGGGDKSIALWKEPLRPLTMKEVNHYLYGFPELNARMKSIREETEKAWNEGDKSKIMERSKPVLTALRSAIGKLLAKGVIAPPEG